MSARCSSVPWPVRKVVMLSADYSCALCGLRSRSERRLTFHHIRPRALGGPDVPTNLVVLCGPCHQALHVAAARPARYLVALVDWFSSFILFRIWLRVRDLKNSF